MNLPHDVSVTNNHSASSGWYGCVVEHNGTNYNANATYVDGSYGQLWMSGANWNGHGWDPARGDNDAYPMMYSLIWPLVKRNMVERLISTNMETWIIPAWKAVLFVRTGTGEGVRGGITDAIVMITARMNTKPVPARIVAVHTPRSCRSIVTVIICSLRLIPMIIM